MTLRMVVALTLLVAVLHVPLLAAETVSLRMRGESKPSARWGVERLKSELEKAGYRMTPSGRVVVDILVDNTSQRLPSKVRKPEGYHIFSSKGRVKIVGFDGPGAMHGCLDLARRVRESGKLPSKLDVSTSPAMSLRSTTIQFMKVGLYDYPITPEEFPFFYDKKMWIEYLDFLAENRFNAITFWNGHPFAYFVKMEKYPEAQDGMPAGQVEKNHQMLMWLGKEAEKRNIWLMFEFYNIHLPVYFAKAHNLPKHGISKPTPLLRDYTGYAIEKFVSEFPNIGLYICPGESLGMEHTDDWINNVIFAAVKRTGKTPPIVIRSWGIDLEHMKKLVGKYPRLYTERKFNVEMIAGTEIDPANEEWAKITGNHVVNVHMMANLEPFRWCPPGYIQKCVQSSVRAGATGVQLFPRKAWRWPYGCDIVEEPELQWHRDWMWFEIWGRYVWDPYLDADEDRNHWLRRLKARYSSPEAAERVLRSYEAAADVLPAIQRLMWAGDDNHTVVAAGLLLEQFLGAKSIDWMRDTPGKGIPFLPVPWMVRVLDYVEALKKCETVKGKTPVALLAAKVARAEHAHREARLAARAAVKNKADAERIESDARAVVLVARFYHDKLKSAIAKALFDAGIDRQKNRSECLKYLKASLEDFRKLTALTRTTYDSITDVPAWNPVNWGDAWFPDSNNPCPYHWSDLLPVYEAEYEDVEAALSQAANKS